MFMHFSDDAKALLSLIAQAAKERGGHQIEVEDFETGLGDYYRSKDS